jgi:redox-sensitive bicupin YhaK (pirin superfamily)
MSNTAGFSVSPLGFPWRTRDPFLFCVHHLDSYPAGNESLGPNASLAGHTAGMDFEGRDGWRMYHGTDVPGFPSHPHRGFETVTLARQGFIDHTDSLGAAARFGQGDAQWMTAGKGIVHSEMFPLVNSDADNPVELFQIWLNLPQSKKMVDPHFSMFWAGDMPSVATTDDRGRQTDVVLVAGSLGEASAPSPPPSSWAAHADADVAIWTMRMQPGATFQLPAAARADANRSLYFFVGSSISIDEIELSEHSACDFDEPGAATIVNGDQPAELLLLQGAPINEPVVQEGPFVMNSRAEIDAAMADYRQTGFGGWPWPSNEPVHGRETARFAKHADGRVEEPGTDDAASARR